MRQTLKALAILAVASFALPVVPAEAQDKIAGKDKEAIEALVRDYILAHPEVLVEALTIYQQREAAESDQRKQAALAHLRPMLERGEGDPVLGNPDGDVTMVEFFDYQCGYCKSMMGKLARLMKEDTKVRWVLKEFPILGPVSETAALASLAANKQGKYEEFHFALMAVRGRLDESTIYQTAREVGLDIDKLKADMKSPDIAGVIQRNKNLAEAMQIRGTPAYIIGEQILPGAVGLDQLQSAIAQTRKDG